MKITAVNMNEGYSYDIQIDKRTFVHFLLSYNLIFEKRVFYKANMYNYRKNLF